MRETQEKVIDIDDVAPEAVEALLCYLYSSTLAVDADYATDVLCLAARYSLDGLKSLSAGLIGQTFDFGNICFCKKKKKKKKKQNKTKEIILIFLFKL